MTSTTRERPLLQLLPALAQKVPFTDLAELPTPVQPLTTLANAVGCPNANLWEKRDDLTAGCYGGNKVRTLEVLFGQALQRGHKRIYATGAYGSNHAMATAIHAPRVGLEAGAILYPQPAFPAAKENLRWMLSLRPQLHVRDLPHWAALPAGVAATALMLRRQSIPSTIMAPGGAVPWGALGYVSAGLELAQQVAAQTVPCPEAVVCPAGSNCTSAGLLVGFALAASLKLGFQERLPWGGHGPQLHAVRVTPWPVTTRWRILRLAHATIGLIETLGGRSLGLDRRVLAARLQLDVGHLGRGYGYPSHEGQTALALWNRHARHPLETTYSGKAAAAFVALASRSAKPLLFWSTKSSAAVPKASANSYAWAPHPMRRWLGG